LQLIAVCALMCLVFRNLNICFYFVSRLGKLSLGIGCPTIIIIIITTTTAATTTTT